MGPQFLPHGFCLHWDPALLCVMIAANLGVACAYFSISAALLLFISKKKNLPYPWMFALFAAFIIACAMTHVMKVWTLYQSFYWAEALIDAMTASVSVLTAVLLWPLIPKILSLRSPAELQEKIRSEEAMFKAKEELELRVEERTRELAEARDQARRI